MLSKMVRLNRRTYSCREVWLDTEMDGSKIYTQPKFAKCGGRVFWSDASSSPSAGHYLS